MSRNNSRRGTCFVFMRKEMLSEVREALGLVSIAEIVGRGRRVWEARWVSWSAIKGAAHVVHAHTTIESKDVLPIYCKDISFHAFQKH